MALTIGDDTITSDRTGHTAHSVPGAEHSWEVSWLPGRPVDRNSAITAMVLADVTAPGDVDAGHRLWIHIEGWAAELGLRAPEVLTRTAAPPERAGTGRNARAADPEAAE